MRGTEVADVGPVRRRPSIVIALLGLLVTPAVGGCEGLISDPAGADFDGSGGAAAVGGDGALDGACVPLDRFYSASLWPGVIRPRCVSCHRPGGPAQASDFVLPDDDATIANLEVLSRLATSELGARPRILVKPLGGDGHGGGPVLSESETAYGLLETFVALVRSPPECEPAAVDAPELTLVQLGPSALFRKAALSLAGRLPTDAELERLAVEGEGALAPLLAELMREPGFYERLREAWNDILLTDAALVDRVTHPAGYLDEAAYPDRLWFNALSIEGGRREMSDAARLGLTRGPLELIVHVVREGRPFTEILTADYVMVNPHAARSYGVFREGDFADPDDPHEFRPVRLPSVDGAAAVFPHAGILTSPYYLHRYPSTPTNRNRHRARMVYLHFLDTDVMDLSPSGADPTEVAELDNPVRDASQCSVCHRLIDPLAGAFQDFDDIGRWAPREDGWYDDSFPPGFDGALLPTEETPRALQWLAQRLVGDPRFAEAVTAHAFQILFGRRPLPTPDDPGADDFTARLAAYERQQALLSGAAEVFVEAGFDFKHLLTALILSPSYRAAGLEAEPEDLVSLRVAESVGAPQLLTPEKITRKLRAAFGEPWIYRYQQPFLELDRFRLLYGGIDSRSTAVRISKPNPLMASVSQLMANDVACRFVGRDLERPLSERAFLFGVDPEDRPSDPAAAARIREAIAALHERLLGEDDPEEIAATQDLFVRIQAEGAASVASGASPLALENRCWQGVSSLKQDPHYTVRAWMAVVAYLLQTYEFLHE